MCCYLCLRQFQTEAGVHQHERVSQMHRDNLNNDKAKAKAIAKLKKAGVELVFGNNPAGNDEPKYRDRAKERQQAFGNQKRVSLPMKKSSNQPDFDAALEEANIVPAAPSKGASLLGKMGWSTGEGLGAQGTGMTAPIATEMYVQGVGLGAQGGKIGDATKEAAANTKSDYNDFLAKTKDKAKERFESME